MKAVGTLIAIVLIALALHKVYISSRKVPEPKDSYATQQTSYSSQESIEQCENTPQKRLYDQLLAQEQASPINFASSLGPQLAQLAPTVQQQQQDCEAGYSAN